MLPIKPKAGRSFYFLCFLYFFLIQVSSVLAQEGSVLFRDDFDRNENFWTIQTRYYGLYSYDRSGYAAIKNGSYHIGRKKLREDFFERDKNRAPSAQVIAKIAPAKNYELEASIQPIRMDQDDWFGLYWGETSGEKQERSTFLVSKTGEYSISLLGESKNNPIGPLTGQLPIKIKKEFYQLKVQVIGKETFFYINDSLIRATYYPNKDTETVVTGIGFFVQNTTKQSAFDVAEVAIDYVVLRKKNKGPNLIIKQDSVSRNAVIKTHAVIKGTLEPIAEGYRKSIIEKSYEKQIIEGAEDTIIETERIVGYDTTFLDYAAGFDQLRQEKIEDSRYPCLVNKDAVFCPDERTGQFHRFNIPIIRGSTDQILAISDNMDTIFLKKYYQPLQSGLRTYMSILTLTRDSEGIYNQVVDSSVIKNVFRSEQQMAISPDRKILIMAEFGNQMQWSRKLEGTDYFSAPKNLKLLGKNPYISADGQYLYFSSTNYDGLGHSDIYVSKRLNNSWSRWSKPQNLGIPINTTGSEEYFQMNSHVMSVHRDFKNYEFHPLKKQ